MAFTAEADHAWAMLKVTGTCRNEGGDTSVYFQFDPPRKGDSSSSERYRKFELNVNVATDSNPDREIAAARRLLKSYAQQLLDELHDA